MTNYFETLKGFAYLAAPSVNFVKANCYFKPLTVQYYISLVANYYISANVNQYNIAYFTYWYNGYDTSWSCYIYIYIYSLYHCYNILVCLKTNDQQQT